MDWELVKNIVSTTQDVLASFGIIVGGLWAYYRFVRFRTLKPRLGFSFDLESINYSQDMTVAIVAVKGSNRGNTRVDLRKNGENRCFLQYDLLSPIDSPGASIAIDKTSEELKNCESVFTSHKWIEPGETIDDVKVLNIPTKNSVAIQLELIIFGEQKWSASAAFPLTGNTGHSSFISEDEQDEYDEAEARIIAIKSILSKVKTTIQISNLSTESKDRLIALVDNVVPELKIDTALKIESDKSDSRKLEEICGDMASLELFSEESEKTLAVALESISAIFESYSSKGRPIK